MPRKKTKTASSNSSGSKRGRRRSKVSEERPPANPDNVPLHRIWSAHRSHGGKLTYNEIEEKYNLRKANGMTAWRKCREYERKKGWPMGGPTKKRKTNSKKVKTKAGTKARTKTAAKAKPKKNASRGRNARAGAKAKTRKKRARKAVTA